MKPYVFVRVRVRNFAQNFAVGRRGAVGAPFSCQCPSQEGFGMASGCARPAATNLPRASHPTQSRLRAAPHVTPLVCAPAGAREILDTVVVVVT
jgi:hypothetical protein